MMNISNIHLTTRMKQIIFLLLIALVFTIPTFDSAFALCDANVNYENALKESELVFKGTVTRLDNSGGPQKVYFDIHEVIKGEITGEKYVLENSGHVIHDDIPESSSVSVYYKIGKTFKVYVMDGQTSQCTTKRAIPPPDYVFKDDSILVPEPSPVCPKGTIIQNNNCITPTTFCGEGATYHDGLCLLNQIENSNQTKNQNDKWPDAYQDVSNDSELKIRCESDTTLENDTCDSLCQEGTAYVNGICHVIKSDEPTHMEPSIFLDGFFFMIVISPFFIPGSVIFIVLSKTPRYNREIRIAVCIAAILVLLYFLWGLVVGWYPLGYA